MDRVDSLVVAAPHEHSLVVDLVCLSPLDLKAVVQLKDQSLVLLWI